MKERIWNDWHDHLAVFLELKDEFCNVGGLIQLLAELIPFDESALFAYRADERPVVIYNDFHKDWRRNNLDDYLAGAYLLDPFFMLLRERESSGIYRLSDIAPPNFSRSAYYLNYYRAGNVGDEINLLVSYEPGVTLALILERRRTSRRFSPAEMERLEAVRPVLEIMLARALKNMAMLQSDARHQAVHEQLKCALELFGSSLLTPREREILQLLLKGYPSHGIAQRLRIAPGTVKVHRKRIYSKLDIRSQSELFPMFIGALSCARADNKQDPLIAYLARPEKQATLGRGGRLDITEPLGHA